ncbi:C1q-like domain-containing protein [Bacillus gaemokensis]|uniref:C1q-like domain-containing protein n=1 Tax=Bacillus gaemokensis TaxID=574375 RepID=UPI000691BA39|nr:hypothetical protein [Bacillus gaemokensis]KYG25861.1 hypothetical protein AZF08_17695 [Bacillus gaemokensis]
MRASGFRAANTAASIPIPVANQYVKVLFSNKQFDLDNEYNATTSTFIAKTAGVYHFNASIIFQADINIDYQLGIAVTVNRNSSDVDNEFSDENSPFMTTLEINTIVQLNAGDSVEIFALSSTPGQIIAREDIRFAGARFPSPLT